MGVTHTDISSITIILSFPCQTLERPGHETLRQCYQTEWPLSTVPCTSLGVVPIDYPLGAGSTLKTSAFLCWTSSRKSRISDTELKDNLSNHLLLKLTDANWDIWDVIPACPIDIMFGTRLHNVSVPYPSGYSFCSLSQFSFTPLFHQ